VLKSCIRTYPSLLQHKQWIGIAAPEYSIAIRVKNEAQRLPLLIESLCLSNTNFDEIELVFLDSGSTDETIKYLDTINCSIYTISPDEFTYGDTCNLMIELCHGDYIIFLSGHVRIASYNIWKVLPLHLKDGDHCALRFRQVPSKELGCSLYEQCYLNRTFPEHNVLSHQNKAFSNAASLVLRSAWHKVKFRNVIASEDYFWACDICSYGMKIKYASDIVIEHSHNEDKFKVYERVLLNKIARYGNTLKPYKTITTFIGIMFLMIKNGSSLLTAIEFSISHASAYLHPILSESRAKKILKII
jgi:glycosyltransferase involved in cell wall biosynthesis